MIYILYQYPIDTLYIPYLYSIISYYNENDNKNKKDKDNENDNDVSSHDTYNVTSHDTFQDDNEPSDEFPF